MSEVKYAISILKEKLANADRHNLAYQRLSVAEMEAIWGTLEKSDKDYAELKAQRDALAENEGYKQAFYEMAEMLGVGARPDSPKNVFDLVIKPKLEALMKDRGKLASENITLTGLVTSWPQERCPITEAVTDVQPDDLFPETNSYLNSVRAAAFDDLYAAFVNHSERAGLSEDASVTLRECNEAMQHCCDQLLAGEPS